MNLAMRLVLAVAASAALGGCNLVMTQTPMFSAADRAGAPPIRPGVWRDDKPDCQVDETQPQNAWPKCAGAQPSVGSPSDWLEVGGDPALLQLPLQLPGAGQAEPTYYIYLAYRPLKVDEAGRVIAMKQWPVRCGPPPLPDPETPAGQAPASERIQAGLARMSPTKAPLPGMTMNEMGGCAPASAAALRNAARLSEAWADDNPNSHWVRVAGPGDEPPATAQSLGEALQGPAAGAVEPAPAAAEPAPPSRPIAAASPLRGFHWTYRGDPPGDRHWTSPDGVIWTETYPNGYHETQAVGARAVAAGCPGVITTKTYSPTAQTFIPDPGCFPMALRFRFANQPWRALGEMRALVVRVARSPP